MRPSNYLPGLTPLRFFAASLVVLDHANYQLGQAGFFSSDWPLLNRGAEAVSFFFVLSGYLITHLLLIEINRTGTIDIASFYFKRIKRIWPLYFFVVIAGLCLYNFIFPRIGVDYEVNYTLIEVIPLLTFFMANAAYSFFNMGGIIAVTWSIAIEEQFYLVWAPLVRSSLKKLPIVLWSIYAFWVIVHLLNDLELIPYSHSVHKFIWTMQFHSMALGALGAYYMSTRGEWLLGRSFFSSKKIQQMLLMFLISLFAFWSPHKAIFYQLLPWLFLWLVMDISRNKKPLLDLENRFLIWLGSISYGVYMYHYFAIYACMFLFQKTVSGTIGLPLVMVFILLCFVLTVALAHTSFKYMETPILRLGRKKH